VVGDSPYSAVSEHKKGQQSRSKRAALEEKAANILSSGPFIGNLTGISCLCRKKECANGTENRRVKKKSWWGKAPGKDGATLKFFLEKKEAKTRNAKMAELGGGLVTRP